ncbi:unnamed protein product [Timema podura]|uniref:Uncharacterized protein n=1 Tax=Timema podura TaxID=61482 RepID=A0ABN7NN12_TIMPD|nr:unnamed protein product [Timema podura]
MEKHGSDNRDGTPTLDDDDVVDLSADDNMTALDLDKMDDAQHEKDVEELMAVESTAQACIMRALSIVSRGQPAHCVLCDVMICIMRALSIVSRGQPAHCVVCDVMICIMRALSIVLFFFSQQLESSFDVIYIHSELGIHSPFGSVVSLWSAPVKLTFSEMSCLCSDENTEEKELMLLEAVLEEEENIGGGYLT